MENSIQSWALFESYVMGRFLSCKKKRIAFIFVLADPKKRRAISLGEITLELHLDFQIPESGLAINGLIGGLKEAAGQIQIFGGHAQPPAMCSGELRGNVLEIGHAGNINPAIRHGHHHIGAAEADRAQKIHAPPDIGKRLADQVLAGHAHMHAA